LGAHLAASFHAAGAPLYLTGRDQEALERLRATLLDSDSVNADAAAIHCGVADLASPAGVARLVSAAEEALGELTVLVNNAAIQGPIGPLWDNDPCEWEQTLRVNLFAPAALCAAALPQMRARRYGKILNLSGGGATGPRPNFSAYAASKAALVRLTEVIAQETADCGVDANCIAPGAMNTRMLAEVMRVGPERAGAKEHASALKAAQAGDAIPRTAAELAVFLASAAGDGISGRLISAVWDDWRDLQRHREELRASDIYTLRRIVPGDRGKEWGTR
jgi:3-oxoacyl-[acyl-carrier protein] reductase